mgnify:CR=1 FL=1
MSQRPRSDYIKASAQNGVQSGQHAADVGVQDDEAASLPGHSARRLITLVTDPSRMIGDHEQYAVAMALMARELGIPARVIYGYRVGSGQTITGDQVGAWPELYLDGLGWVTFDPTPSTDRVWDEEDQPKPPETQPYVENPPPPPEKGAQHQGKPPVKNGQHEGKQAQYNSKQPQRDGKQPQHDGKQPPHNGKQPPKGSEHSGKPLPPKA